VLVLDDKIPLQCKQESLFRDNEPIAPLIKEFVYVIIFSHMKIRCFTKSQFSLCKKETFLFMFLLR
jgi:hypothetical protein